MIGSRDTRDTRLATLWYFNSHLKTKIASNFDKGSIESAIFRAFRGALDEGATYFRLEPNVYQQCGLRFVTTVNYTQCSQLFGHWRKLGTS